MIYLAESDGVNKLYRRSMDDLIALEIPGTEGAGPNPFFSPDGESIAFLVDGKLKRVPLMGGQATTLADVFTSSDNTGGDWGPEDTIVFTAMSSASRMSLYRISGGGGEPEILAVPDLQKGEYHYRDPEILPDGSAVLFTVWSRNGLHTAALSLESGEQKIIIEDGRSPRYMATGHLVYELSGTGTLMVVLFDLDRLEVRGDPVPFLEGVRYNRVNGADLVISSEGTLAYILGDAGSRSLVWVDHEGKSTLLMETQGSLELPRVSGDGQRVALTNDYDIFVYDLPREVLSPLTGEGFNHAQAWTAEGNRVAFSSTKDGVEPNIFLASPGGSEEWERLTTSPNEQYAGSFSPDGKVLAFTEVDPSSGRDLWLLPTEGDRSPQSFLRTEGNEWEPRFAPNGQWIAYTSDESGQDEVYVRPYPVGPGEWQISNQGGRDPLWAPDGRTLFYRNSSKMMAVAVEIEPAFSPGRPRLLFEGEYAFHVPGHINHDISPDGQRFLMVWSETAPEQTRINVVLNWFEELKRLVPTN
jgi:serine/threonine-protein kinase